MLHLKNQDLEIIRSILRQFLNHDQQALVFGSRVAMKNLKPKLNLREFSDIDIAIIGKEKLPSELIIKLKNAFEDSNLTIMVDIIDYNNVSDIFKKNIDNSHVKIFPYDADSQSNQKSFGQEFFNLDESEYNQDYFQAIKQEVLSDNKQKGIFDLGGRFKKYLQQSLSISSEISDKYQTLIVCGMGGSSLGAKAICGTRFFDSKNIQRSQKNDVKSGGKNGVGDKHDKKIHFLDNIHHQELNNFLASLDFKQTAFLFVSKSGKTMETICQTLLIIDFYQEQLAENNASNLYFITEDNSPDANPLAKIAANYRRPIIEHDKDVGGRYSCFTPVALIPVAFYNICISDYLNGALDMLNDFINNKTDLIEKGAYFLQQAEKRDLHIQVSMPYLARLYHFNYWYNQLLAESIGKNGKGITPLKALGSTDQHSVLQLFLDGKRDKFFSFLTTNNQNKGDDLKLPKYLADDMPYLQNNKLGDVIYANQEATIATIKDKKHLLRRFNIETLDEYIIGKLMMYFMLETIFYAYMVKINPFDQPAVEKGKIYAKSMLSKQETRNIS